MTPKEQELRKTLEEMESATNALVAQIDAIEAALKASPVVGCNYLPNLVETTQAEATREAFRAISYILDCSAPMTPQQVACWGVLRNARNTILTALEQQPAAYLVYAKGSHRYMTLTFDIEKVPEIFKGGDVVPLGPIAIKKQEPPHA